MVRRRALGLRVKSSSSRACGYRLVCDSGELQGTVEASGNISGRFPAIVLAVITKLGGT
jgi:hypothetical protein